MKTAMEELMELNDFFKIMGVTIEWDKYLEKEKELIIDACNANLKGLLANGKDYYDLNFNHHIESEPNTYTNFTPYDANAKAEYNDSLTNFTPNL